MSKDYPQYIKLYAHDVLKQSKPYYKSVKRLVIYKNNVPYGFSRKTGEFNKLNRNQ